MNVVHVTVAAAVVAAAGCACTGMKGGTQEARSHVEVKVIFIRGFFLGWWSPFRGDFISASRGVLFLQYFYFQGGPYFGGNYC